jgi:hypothetical protein
LQLWLYIDVCTWWCNICLIHRHCMLPMTNGTMHWV